MKVVTYQIVTFVVLFQLYATTSAAPPIQPPSGRNGMQTIVRVNEVHPHAHGHKFSVRLIETPETTTVFIRNLLHTMSKHFHVNLNEGRTVVLLQEDQDGWGEQIYTERVLTPKNQQRLHAHNTRDHQPVPPMITHSHPAPPMTPHLPPAPAPTRSQFPPASPMTPQFPSSPTPMTPQFPSSPTPMTPFSPPSPARRPMDTSTEEDNGTIETQ